MLSYSIGWPFYLLLLLRICRYGAAVENTGEEVVRRLGSPATIFCDGRIPTNWKWPAELADYGAPPSSPQQLCAIAEFGGHEYYNMGGYCEPRLSSSRGELWRLTAPENLDRINFDTTRNTHPIQPLLKGNDRAYHFCQLRCWCPSAGIVHPATQSAKVILIASERTIALNLSGPPSWGPQRGPIGGNERNVQAISIRTKPITERSISRLEERYLSIQKSNRVSCIGPAYPHDLPFPYDNDQGFRSLPRLCPAALSGGYNDANAGGVCINKAPGEHDVSFLDEVTPHTVFQHLNWPDAIAIRVWCYVYCRCSSDPPSPPGSGARQRPLGFLQNAKYDFSNGGISVVATQGSLAGETFVLKTGNTGEANGHSHAEGSCYKANGEACEMSGIEDLFEPLPSQVPTEKEISDEIASSGVCKDTCNGNCGRSCSARMDCGTEGDCKCIVPRYEQGGSWNFGVDPVFPFAVCISISQYLATEASLPSRRRGGLPKRAVDFDDSALRSQVVCACNSTYIGVACCENDQGLVWEEPGGRRGVLGL
ncbi:MAG: hypothetical protein M1814_003437 [Vezdaea aestivalis]|nr:MAG: hypothetical protein M1814_003437 [Vezdaea aestivalis]